MMSRIVVVSVGRCVMVDCHFYTNTDSYYIRYCTILDSSLKPFIASTCIP